MTVPTSGCSSNQTLAREIGWVRDAPVSRRRVDYHSLFHDLPSADRNRRRDRILYDIPLLADDSEAAYVRKRACISSGPNRRFA